MINAFVFKELGAEYVATEGGLDHMDGFHRLR
jgi:hypothetical protein